MIHISFTDQWQTLLDENGKPLIGRVKFLNADSTQYKSIYYDIQGETQGENPQYTLQDGRLEHQVFIGSGVYTCRVEKFLGTDVSSMRDHANDDTYWQNYKSFKIYGGVDEVEGGSDLAAGFCDTIAALRLVDPSEHGVVSVIGYYSKEDGIEPRTYVWVEGNNDAEDYGSTIVSSVTGYTSAGRWKLCESPIVCATTFGVFPNRASTITPSELTTKATALAQYARLSPVCTAILFNRGNYEFAEGARLSFTKKVITGASVVSGTTIKFGMYVEDGQTPSGTIEIAFIGGLESEQKSFICTNDSDSYVTFSFGAGVVRTSWLQNIEKHIVASIPYEGLTIILDKSSTQTFYDNGKTIKNWHFKGCDKALYQVVGSNALFQSCSFEGKCFQVNNARFLDCGTLYQESICANDTKITDDVIWGSSGHIKSEGTTFVCSDIRMTKAYTGSVDNSCIKAIGENPKIVSNFELTLKYLDRDWKLHGKIGFENSDELYASAYNQFSDCVAYALNNSKTINLESKVFSYTIDVTDVTAQRIFKFKNGFLTLTKTGTSSVKDLISLDNITMTTDNTMMNVFINAYSSYISGLESGAVAASTIDLILKDCVVNATNLKVGHCDANATTFNGSISIFQSNNVYAQKFVNCNFNSQLTLANDGTSTIVNLKVEGCTFSIDNSGTPIEAINYSLVNNGSFANESNNRYVIGYNVYFGDAFMKPIHKAVFKETSTTDNSSATGKIVGNLVYFASGTLRNAFILDVPSFSTYSYLAEKLFHFGIIDKIVLKAEPLTYKTFLYGQGNDGEIYPTKGYFAGTDVVESKAIYRVLAGENIAASQITTHLTSVDWLVEIEKV